MAAPASNTKTRTATTCRTYFACLVFWAILGACGAIGHQAAAKAADAKGGYFELCPKGHRTGALALETTARQVLPRRSFGSPASACERGAGVIVWRGDGSSFCCPAAAGWCGGCAEANDKEDACGKCLGGWVLERGYCTACMDFPGWHDAKGRNCYAAGCSKDRFQGSSSAMACCSCGGGLRQATRFGYYTEPLLIGHSAVTGRPLPRTASHYSVDSGCELLNFNLTINSTSGELQLQEGCETVGCGRALQDFQVLCRITAHQGGLEASARMHITASNFLVYENTALVVTGEKSFPALASPEVKLNDLTLACLPVQSPHDGKPSPWQLASDGSLHIDASQASIAGLTDLTLPYLSSAPGGLCQVRNATRHTVAIPVLLPKTWTSISYPFESVFVAPGTTFGPAMNPHGHDNGEQGCVAPSRYSASCTAPGVEIVFDELTGVVSAFGFSLFRLDTQTGSIDVSPEQDASQLFDDLQSQSHRGLLEVSCTVMGLFEWQVGVPVVPVHGKVTVYLQDLTCWKDTQLHGRAVQESSLGAGECRRACRADVRCAAYAWKAPAECLFLSPCGPHPVKDCRQYSAFTKIPNCSVENTCLNLTGSDPAWLYSGVFCPVAYERAADPSNSWIFQKTAVTPQDVFYLAPETDDSLEKCNGGLFLTRSNISWDFENSSSEYMELFGEHLACLTAEVPHSIVQATFHKGRQKLLIVDNKTDIGSGLELTLQAQSCEAPELPEELLQIDDPSTKTAMDFSLHACDCFPEGWKDKPVTSSSFTSVPPGSGNQYVPSAIEIARGALTCDQASLLAKYIMPQAASTYEDCHFACQLEPQCLFFWAGLSAAVEQCRLYSGCQALLTEPGSRGMLAARAPSTTLCRRADPSKCWATIRRNYLHADTDRGQAISCLHKDLMEQCDMDQMVGGLGVEECFRCQYAETTGTWKRKRPLPQTFSPGSELGISCWSDRYAAVTPSLPGKLEEEYTITCSGGSWWGPSKEPGLSGLACGYCVQVTWPDFVMYQEQGRQELYFLKNINFIVAVDLLQPLAVGASGLEEASFKSSDNLLVKSEDSEPLQINPEEESLLQMAVQQARGKSPKNAKSAKDSLLLTVHFDKLSDKSFRLKDTSPLTILCLRSTKTGFKTPICSETYVAEEQYNQPSIFASMDRALVSRYMPPWQPGQSVSKSFRDVSFTRDCKNFALSNLSLSGKSHEFAGCGLASAAEMLSQTRVSNLVPTVRFMHPRTGLCLSPPIQPEPGEEVRWGACREGGEGGEGEYGGYGEYFWNGSQLTLVAHPDLCLTVSSAGGVLDLCSNQPQTVWSERSTLMDGRGDWCLQSTPAALWAYSWLGRRIARSTRSEETLETLAVRCKDLEPTQQLLAVDVVSSVNCPEGSLVSYIKKERNSVGISYRCNRMVSIGSCFPYLTPPYDHSDAALLNAQLDCPANTGLQQLQVEESTSTTSFRLLCCYTGRLAMGLVRKHWVLYYQTWEGVYCPTQRDQTGRLQYEQRKSFSYKLFPNGRLQFNWRTGQWCLTWQDITGKQQESCTDSTVADPLSDGNLQNSKWATTAVLDFDSTYPISEPETEKLPKAPIPKPSLRKLAAVQPETAEECKQLVTKWKNVGKKLPSTNPCHYVTGKAPKKWRSGEGYASYWDTQNGVGDAGFDYQQVLDCFGREDYRLRQDLQDELDAAKSAKDINVAFAGLKFPCAFVPGAITAPFGLGTKLDFDDACELALDTILESKVGGVEVDAARKIWERADEAQDDCIGAAAGFARVWCDLHCVKDAVQSGDQAILKSLEDAVDVLNTNFDALSEYYATLVSGKIEALADQIKETNNEQNGQDVRGIQRVLNSRLASVRKLLSVGQLNSIGREASSRALQGFIADLQWQAPGGNSTAHLVGRAETLLAALASSTEQGLQSSRGVAAQITAAAKVMERVGRSRNNLLGVYHQRSEEWKQRQKKLFSTAEAQTRQRKDALQQALQEVQEAKEVQLDSKAWLLVELDTTWWKLRATFDKYLTEAKKYATVYSDAVRLLQSYMSCSLQFLDVHEGYAQFQAADTQHQEALLEAWSTMVPLAGLLVSKILDSDAMIKLSNEDARAALHAEFCIDVGTAVNRSLDEGLSGQTMQQMLVLFKELRMLQQAFQTHAMVPDNIAMVEQTMRRAQSALEVSLAMRPILADRLRRQFCT